MDKSLTILNNKNTLKITCPTDHTLHKTLIFPLQNIFNKKTSPTPPLLTLITQIYYFFIHKSIFLFSDMAIIISI